MRMRLRTAALLTIAGALTAGSVTPATAAPAPVTTWNADLRSGEGAGVDVTDGSARLDPAHAFVAPLDDSGSAEGAQGVPTGLLTLPERRLDAPTDRVDSTVVGDVPAGSTASVDVRGLRANGNWTEWIPASPQENRATTTLPESTSRVQARLVLTSEGGATPTVRDVTLTARPATRSLTEAVPNTEAAALSYRVFATREGLAGSTTANGHVIADRDHFVALPSRRALSPNGKSDYSVKVCAPGGKCAFAPVWDVGPWNTRDDYWNAGAQRQQWGDLPQGVPQAQAAYKDNYNGGNDQYNRQVANPAGIDLGDGVFWDALGLKDNSYVQVDYLWTGNARLSKVVGDDPVDVLAAPDAAAKVVGIAAEGAAVPVQCTTSAGGGVWLRIGDNEFVDAAAVPGADKAAPCAADTTTPAPQPAPTTPADPTTGDATTPQPAPATVAPKTAGTATRAPTAAAPATGDSTAGNPTAGAPAAGAPAAGSSTTGTPAAGSSTAGNPTAGNPGTGTGDPTTTRKSAPAARTPQDSAKPTAAAG